jgi:hypothetical protein
MSSEANRTSVDADEDLCDSTGPVDLSEPRPGPSYRNRLSPLGPRGALGYWTATIRGQHMY